MKTDVSSSCSSLVFGPPRQEEYECIANIITEAFAESSKMFFGARSPDLVAYRTSLIRQRHSLMKLSQQGKIKTSHRVLIARDAETGRVIGVAIWSLEDDWTEEGMREREEEMKLATPMGPLPRATNMHLYAECQVVFGTVQEDYMHKRRRCYLKYLCVDANVQRSGAGTALLKVVRKDAGDRPIYLEAANTRPAVKFYTKLHFDDLCVFRVGEAVFNAMKLEPTTASLLDC
ncbi:hypothetical protein CBS101457_001942 [Exobasidium rhododendri]|nr:hypothetical protein CBS101457_001942 [Exobasidium rhododendri]